MDGQIVNCGTGTRTNGQYTTPNLPDGKHTFSVNGVDYDFECRLNGRVVECGNGTNGVYTTPNLPDGNHTFEVTAADDLDNKGTPEVVSWSKGRYIKGY